ncbi:MAG: class I SAM-dependent methyltransferase [Alphaproteobacteria bacterium]
MSDFRCLRCGHTAAARVLDGVPDARFGVPGAWDIVRCGACGLDHTAPRPTGPQLGALYAQYYNFGGSDEGAYSRLRRRFLTSGLYRLFLAIDGDIAFEAAKPPAPDRTRLLDVGCNEGRKLLLYRRNGFAAEGLEVNAVAAAAARRLGFTVHEGDIADLVDPQGFDVLVMSQVIEHVLDLDAALGHCRRLLRPGGALWLSCPNARSWFRALFGRRWINWHVPFHITHLRGRDLSAVLERNGFVVETVRTETPALWVAQSVIAALFARPPRPTRAFRNPLLVIGLMGLARGLLFPLPMLANALGRGDCLVLRARRG